MVGPWPNTGSIQDEYVSEKLRCDIDSGAMRVVKRSNGGDIFCTTCSQQHSFSANGHSQIILGRLFPSVDNWHTAQRALREEMLEYREMMCQFVVQAKFELGLLDKDAMVVCLTDLEQQLTDFRQEQARYDGQPWYRKLMRRTPSTPVSDSP